MKLNIVKLRTNNFRLFKDMEVSFIGKRGIISLIGKNLDFFSSNSSAKSTLPLAIEFALYGQTHLDLTLTDLVTKGVKGNGASASIDFYLNDDHYVVSGNKEIIKNGKTLPIKSKTEYKEFIENLLGVSFNIFTQLLYISNKTESFFLNPDSRAQSQMLIALLNLDFIKHIHAQADMDLKKIKLEYDAAKKNFILTEANIMSLASQIDSLDIGDTTKIINAIEKLKHTIEELRKAEVEYKGRLEGAAKELAVYLTLLDEEKSELKKFEAKVKALSINKNATVCVSCGQPLENGISPYKEAVKELIGKEKSIEEKENFSRNLKLKKDQEESKFNHIVRKRVKKEEAFKKLEYMLKRIEHNQAKFAMKETFEKQRKELIRMLADYQIKMDSLEELIYAAEVIKQSASPKGFIQSRIQMFAKLFNKFIVELSSELLENQMICKVAQDNTKFWIEVFDGQHTYKFAELSEGLAARVRIVAMLALVNSVEALSGLTLNMLFFDEISASIDDLTILEELLFKIKHKYPEKMIFVVSHEKTIKSDYTLIAQRQGNESILYWKEDNVPG